MKLLWKLEVCRMVEVSDLEAAMDLGGHMQILRTIFFPASADAVGTPVWI